MILRNAVLVLLGMTLLVSCNKNSEKKAVVLKNSTDSVSYCSGLTLGMYVKQAGLDTLNSEMFLAAINQVMGKDSNYAIKPEQANQYLQVYFMKKQQKKYEPNIQAGQKFLEENKKKEGVVTTPSGLQYKVITEGKGENPKPTDIVHVHYKGSLLDGKVFDQSDGKNPIKFPVNQVIPGWTEALQLMKPGTKLELYIPYNLAYGERGAPPRIEPFSTLIFEVELLKIEKPEAPKNGEGKNKKGAK